MIDFADVDRARGQLPPAGGQPGLAYGVVLGGELVHAAGLGERYLGGPPPEAGTVFRIASMTKSFTASVVLALRDDGALNLDDLAEEYVPELSGWPPVTPDSARVSIRHLLTMTAGFPTDDPWGDRQQGLPLAEFASSWPAACASTGRPAPGSSTPTWVTRSSAGSSPPSPARPTRTTSAIGCSTRWACPAPATRPTSSSTVPTARLGGYRSRVPAEPGSGRSSPWTRPARSPRWAGCSAACGTSPAG